MEVVHGLIPDRKLGARDVMAGCPTVRLALNNNLLLGTAKIKGVQLFGWANTDLNEVAGMKI